MAYSTTVLYIGVQGGVRRHLGGRLRDDRAAHVAARHHVVERVRRLRAAEE